MVRPRRLRAAPWAVAETLSVTHRAAQVSGEANMRTSGHRLQEAAHRPGVRLSLAPNPNDGTWRSGAKEYGLPSSG